MFALMVEPIIQWPRVLVTSRPPADDPAAPPSAGGGPWDGGPAGRGEGKCGEEMRNDPYNQMRNDPQGGGDEAGGGGGGAPRSRGGRPRGTGVGS